MKTCKRKNPLNIRYSSRNNWKGQIGNSHGFCSFVSMNYGIRASLVLLRSYIRRGYNTIDKIISRWAPPSENDTDAYINYVCHRVGIDAHTIIDASDQRLIGSIFAAMAWIETMCQIDDEELNKVWHDYI